MQLESGVGRRWAHSVPLTGIRWQLAFCGSQDMAKML